MQNIAQNTTLYYINGVPKNMKKLHSAPNSDSKILYQDFTVVRGIAIKQIRGNWMLVKVFDYNNNTPIGWMRWRDDDGQLLIFCNLD